MAKIVKQKYTKCDGSKEVYSYLVPIKKILIEEAGINPDKDIKVEVQKGKIIITN